MIASANERRPSKNIYQDDKKYGFHGEFSLEDRSGSRLFYLPAMTFHFLSFGTQNKNFRNMINSSLDQGIKVAMLALFSSISAADDDAVAPQVRSRVDGDTLVQVSHVSSVLKALFLVQRFRLEGECRNRSQIDQRWLMILIRCMG